MPELAHVNAIWGHVLAVDFTPMLLAIRPIISSELAAILQQLNERFAAGARTNADLHVERSRLVRLWSQFFAQYPVVIGPIWSELPWPADADLDPHTGLDLLLSTVRFITPGNVLGLPAVAVPTAVADGLPTGVQVYADRWREDLCLDAAALIEAGCSAITPIDPA